MTIVDWVALGLIALLALAGAARGLVAGVLSVAGIVCGALLGAKLGPLVLPDGEESPYLPIAALLGAILLAALFEAVGSVAGSTLRSKLRFRPLRTLDSFGGLVLGGATALAIVWVLGAVALQVPGQTELRREAQRSAILRRLNDVVPPRELLNALARVDPFPRIAGPLAEVERPDPRVIREPAVRGAASSVVNIVGTACGLGVVGSGWVARPNLVVTAAHVVAGQSRPTVRPPGGAAVEAVPVAFDSRNDIAVLRVPPGSLGTTPLAARRPAGGRRGRDRRLPGEPRPHRGARPHRPDDEVPQPRRLRERPGVPARDDAARPDPPGELGRSRRWTTSAACRRRSSPRASARTAGTACPRRSCATRWQSATSAGLDRALRASASRKGFRLDCA